MAELIAGIFTASRYKRNQGRIARQATFFAILAVFVIGAWRWSETSSLDSNMGRYFFPGALAAFGAWLAFRIVNYPRFAEFLISVENEMNKVSWPTRGELFRASMVVIVVIFVLTAILFTYDLVLRAVIGWFLGTA